MNSKNVIISLIVVLVIGIGSWYVFSQDKKENINEIQNAVNTLDNNSTDSVDKKTEDEYSKSLQEKADDKANVLTEMQSAVVKEFTVEGTNYKFVPDTILVNKGDTIKINFKNTQGFHDFVVDEFGAATKQIKDPSTETITFVADKVGTFEYYCSVGKHRTMGMKGTLTVK